MPGQYTHTAEVSWLAAAGSASAAAAAAAPENAADMHVHKQGQQLVPTPIPEPDSHSVCSGQVELGNGNASSNYVGPAPEQPGLIATKKRSRPFKIPR